MAISRRPFQSHCSLSFIAASTIMSVSTGTVLYLSFVKKKCRKLHSQGLCAIEEESVHFLYSRQYSTEPSEIHYNKDTLYEITWR